MCGCSRTFSTQVHGRLCIALVCKEGFESIWRSVCRVPHHLLLVVSVDRGAKSLESEATAMTPHPTKPPWGWWTSTTSKDFYKYERVHFACVHPVCTVLTNFLSRCHSGCIARRIAAKYEPLDQEASSRNQSIRLL